MLDALRAAVPVRAPGVWVVGGAVRDALLGIEPRELDLLVEGDAVALARSAGEVVAVHERFGTATVRVGDVLVDLASARRESYASPGALPDVSLGASVEEDLRRRDFTVNAMAVRVEDGAFAAVPGAEDDLRHRRLRVLHRASFTDDPTRMLRGARYAARLGFVLVDDIRPGPLETVSAHRVGAEVRLAMGEPVRVWDAMDGFGLGRAVFGGAWDFDSRVVSRAVGLLGGGVVALGAALRGDVASLLDALGFPARERDVIAAAAGVDGLAVGANPGAVALWRSLRRLPPEAVAVAGARGDVAAARWWLDELRHVRPAVSGDELVAAGLQGPAVGQALERATEAALRGADRDTQLRAALGEDVAG